MGFCGLLNGKGACDQWCDRFFRDQVQNLLHVLGRCMKHTAANNMDAFESPCLCIDGRLFATEITNQDNPALLPRRLDTGLERRTDEFEDQVSATFLLKRFAWILLMVINNAVSTQFAECISTFATTCSRNNIGTCMFGKLNGKCAD